MVNKQTLAATTLAVGATAGIGSVASQPRITRWYSKLRKPSYVPPNGVFPIAWTALYADIAVTSATAIDRLRSTGRDAEARNFIVALAANLILNAGWSWLFFKYQKLGASASRGSSIGGQQRRPGQAHRRGGPARRRRPVAVSAVVRVRHFDVRAYLGTQSPMKQMTV